MVHRSKKVNNESWKLMPLTPEYIEREHGDYVKAINETLENPEITNIALSGSYGVGKSSILQKIVEKHRNRVVNLSLSTLAPLKDLNIDDSVPKQATTTTNRIQQEIVKQLLYREEPNNMPGSRFQRIERFYFGRELLIAVLASLVFSFISFITGWTGSIQSEVSQLQALGLWIHPVVLSMGVAIVVVTRRLFHGRIHIRQFSAVSATVTLDGNSVSYFDQYLDEIVYFFEISDRDIVIFEDFDRFNDSRIFETLLSLNTLLNQSPQIKKKIRFVYAIKDSIFDKIGLGIDKHNSEKNEDLIEDPSLAETVMANRTKFFDLVIPVVPFITHRSARNLTLQILKNIDHKIDSDLIDLTARYVPDMRLLKNICNEFVVFRDRIFSGDGKGLLLSETELFAMMLYKSTHLTDFERIRIGKSNIDRVYKISRNLVESNLTRIQEEVRLINHRLEKIDKINALSSLLGDRFIAHVERTARAISWDESRGEYVYAGTIINAAKLKKAEFWSAFVQEGDNTIIEWRHSQNHSIKLRFSKSDLTEPLRNNLEPGYWNESEKERLKEELEERDIDLKFLRGADMGDLMLHSKYLEEYEGSNQPLELITHQILKDDLAFELARSGYINRNFTLYTSTFHGDRVSPDATNFIIHNLERGVMDIHFELKGEDVEAVVREWGRKTLQDIAFYNISVLDYLLYCDETSADIMIRSLARFGDEQVKFLQAFLENSNSNAKLISRLASTSPSVLVFLVELVTIDESERARLFSVALENLMEKINYKVTSTVADYLLENYQFLEVLKAPLSYALAERVSKVFSKANVKVSDLKSISKESRSSFIQRNLYAINTENISIALDGDDHALDLALNSNESVYNYMLDNLDVYLSVMNKESSTVESKADFVRILEDVLSRDAELLGQIIAGSSDVCLIADLDAVSSKAWPELACNLKFPATFKNISDYINEFGGADINLAKVMESAGILTGLESVDESEKMEVAVKILGARKVLNSSTVRVNLVKSLSLSDYVDFESITPESGDLFALLVGNGVIEDCLEAYEYLSNTDWDTREQFIRNSTKFLEYVTPELVREDLSMVLSSDNIGSTIKQFICDRSDEFFRGADEDDYFQLAKYASSNDVELSVSVIERMAEFGVPSSYIIQFLLAHLEVIESSVLFRILGFLDGDYPKLVSVGWEKPKIINNAANAELLEKLKSLGVVNTYKMSDELFKVNKRRK